MLSLFLIIFRLPKKGPSAASAAPKPDANNHDIMAELDSLAASITPSVRSSYSTRESKREAEKGARVTRP